MIRQRGPHGCRPLSPDVTRTALTAPHHARDGSSASSARSSRRRTRVCSSLAASIPAINTGYGTSYALLGGIDQSVKGNNLIGSPEFKISGGVQYDIPFGANHILTPRVDAYHQGDMRPPSIFNTEQDRIDGYAAYVRSRKFASRRPECGRQQLARSAPSCRT
ncbi:MAG: hypothetical protein R3C54_13580 [Parvularculaceae bacterium]